MKELIDSVKQEPAEDILPSYYSSHLYKILEQLVKLLPDYTRLTGADDNSELAKLLSKLQLEKVKEQIDDGKDDKIKTAAILKLTRNV